MLKFYIHCVTIVVREFNLIKKFSKNIGGNNKHMKKRIFLGYWFYFFGAIIADIGTLAVVLFQVLSLIYVPVEVNPDVVTLYWSVPLTILMAIFMIGAMGYVGMQFTIISEEGIKVRCLWCTIRKLKWAEVKEVRCECFYVSVQGAFSSRWYVFYDGVDRPIRNGIAWKNSPITLPFSKRATKAINEFWKGEIIEKVYR
jgi:hypothetical protein